MRLTKITFFTQSGGEQTLNLQNYESQTNVEFWGDNDKAISGKIRHNTRGLRGTYRLSYDHSTEATAYRNLLNNIRTDLNNGEESIVISEGADLSNARYVIPTDKFREQLEYEDQIGKFMPELEFVQAGRPSASTGGWVEPGWVEPGWVEQGV